MSDNSIAIYIHWPFCISKCPYCDFNSHVAERDVIAEEWIRVYKDDLDYFFSHTGKRVLNSIYFGGGTPSLMNIEIVEAILNHINDLWGINYSTEITLEANPNSIEIEKFRGFRNAGVNRVSVGIQALNNTDLKFLGRAHDISDAILAIETARKCFENYTFDLIYARPEQTLEQWKNELREALCLVGNHLSLYQLTIEKGTEFYSQYSRGGFRMPDDETAADMYELTGDIMSYNDMPAYEISNYARAGYESRHNICYWQYDDFIGIGPGAHGRFINNKGERTATVAHHKPEKWLNAGNRLQINHVILNKDAVKEAILSGLRLTKGINRQYFSSKFDKDIYDYVNKSKFNRLIEGGFVEESKTRVYLTKKGLLLYNTVLSELL